jgi:diguanylate cyclase (GGDEF)-like protein/PAS domain S-box-containing protein
MEMTGTYDYRLVALSVAVAIVASYAALDLAGRVTVERKSRAFWQIGGATSMGLGIWAMHYIGMLAFSMPIPVLYDLPTVGLSLLAAIVASGSALHVLSRRVVGWPQQLLGSLAMGSGIAAMHYVGMAAMRMSARIHYNAGLVAVSIVLAVVISLIALILSFRVRDEKHATPRKIISALIMGSAIPLMHYTGMAAASFYPSGPASDLSHALKISLLGTLAIAVTTLLILTLAISASFFDRWLGVQKAHLLIAQEGEIHFRALAEALPQMIWTADADGAIDYVNQRWREYAGIGQAEPIGAGWSAAIHPDDISVVQQTWMRCVRNGDALEMEYRLRRAADQSYHWHLARAVPLKDSQGQIAKWFGTCTDIEEQKHSQERLEQQIKERTEELTAANESLRREMQDREQVQEELDAQNVAVVADITRRSDRTTQLSKMVKLLQSAINTEEADEIVCGFAPKIFPDFRGAILLLDAASTLLEVKGSWGECKLPDVPSFDMSSCWALRTGQRHLIESGDKTARCPHALLTTSAYVCVPIMAQGGAVGILHLQAIEETSRPFESELLLTNSFAEQVGASLANLRLQQALRQQSTIDVLTGLFNRRHLEQSLERELRRAARTDQPVGIIMFDLDHFKKVNDTFGHEAGDTVLRTIGVTLSRGARAEDMPCRFGGEEFLLIMPGATLEGSRSRAERLRSEIKALTITQDGTLVGTITVSIGVAAFPLQGLSAKDLIAAADAALYRAKHEGRDRVVVADVPDTVPLAAAAHAPS